MSGNGKEILPSMRPLGCQRVATITCGRCMAYTHSRQALSKVMGWGECASPPGNGLQGTEANTGAGTGSSQPPTLNCGSTMLGKHSRRSDAPGDVSACFKVYESS